MVRITEDLIDKARYICSPEHKGFYNKEWGNPHPRPDSSLCPKEITVDENQDFKGGELTGWVREALRKGACSESQAGGYPRYIWYYHAATDTVFEGRETNPGHGQYKGYPLERDEWPAQIKSKYA